MILSYILHGYIPFYTGKHHDPLLNSKLLKLDHLLQIDSSTYSHFGSSLRYSQQAQPINALLDTLVRPNADTEIDPPSHIEWKFKPQRAIPHVILTDSQRSGGQWTRASGTESDDIATLSYAEMLSLPGYSFKQYFKETHGNAPPDFMRPSRTLVASYYAAYPKAVGIDTSIRLGSHVSNVSRITGGFIIDPAHVKCKQLVLASGIFTHDISPPALLKPLQRSVSPSLPILVIGSGFSAADVILSASPQQQIIHLFKWDPENNPSPLRGCHQQAYPEYAGVYRQMKAAASQHAQVVSPQAKRKTNPFFTQRDWSTMYEGLPNVTITKVYPARDGTVVEIKFKNGTTAQRIVGSLAYHVGRRGSLAYLDASLLQEIIGARDDEGSLENDTMLLRRGGTRNGGALVAEDVYAIGSLTGDSLVRHAFGVCVDAAAKIMAEKPPGSHKVFARHGILNGQSKEFGDNDLTSSKTGNVQAQSDMKQNGWRHVDLHIDRRDLIKKGH